MHSRCHAHKKPTSLDVGYIRAFHVTKEQQIRCVSQGTYALVGGLLETGIPVLPQRQLPVIGQQEFAERRDGFGLFYRREELEYKRNVPSGQEFQFRIRLASAERRRQFTVADFEISGPTAGTVTFVGK